MSPMGISRQSDVPERERSIYSQTLGTQPSTDLSQGVTADMVHLPAKAFSYSPLNATEGSRGAAPGGGIQAAPAQTETRPSVPAANRPIFHGSPPSGRMSVRGRTAATASGRPTTTPHKR